MKKKEFFIEKNNVKFDCNQLSVKGELINIPGFLILEILGNGANAVVVKAKSKISEQVVAVKIWLPSDSKYEELMIRAREEIKKFARLSFTGEYSPYLTRYYASGKVSGYYYCIMEYIEQREYVTLNELLNKDNRVALSDRYIIISKVISGLRVAHEIGVYHGDLHGDNVLINKQYEPKIIDFGTSVNKISESSKRDNRMMFKFLQLTLDQYYDDRILLQEAKDVRLPQNCVRIILKATAKIIVLLNFWKEGKTDVIIEDIARFSALVPFFDLDYIMEKMKICDNPYYCNLFKKVLLSTMIGENSAKMIEREIINELYFQYQAWFINLCRNELCEEKIYRNYYDAYVFNAPLYNNDGSGLSDEYNMERNAIQKIIE